MIPKTKWWYTARMYENPNGQASEVPREIIPAGRKVVLRKIRVKSGTTSDIATGEELSGVLRHPITQGSPIILESGNTSNVSNIFSQEGRTFIETQTSLYELVAEPEAFTGFHMESELGTIALPEDTREAVLEGENVDERFVSTWTGKEIHVLINKDALRGVLLESHGGEIFTGMGSRFFILVRVGNVHLPFYISSEGTSEKRRGEWYPFFGYTGDWIIKGHVDRDDSGKKNGDMTYHPEISRIQQLLNDNFKIPEEVTRESGTMSKHNAVAKKWETIFDLKKHLHHQNEKKSEFAQRGVSPKERDIAFVQRVTGYAPSRNIHPDSGGHSDEWIQSIVAHISTQ